MKLKHQFVLATTLHFQSKERLYTFCILALFFLLCITSCAITNEKIFTAFAIIATIIFGVYNLLITLYDETRFEIINTTNDEEAYIRSLLRKK